MREILIIIWPTKKKKIHTSKKKINKKPQNGLIRSIRPQKVLMPSIRLDVNQNIWQNLKNNPWQDTIAILKI